MQGAFSLVLFYLIGVTSIHASIQINEDPQTIEEKPRYYPQPKTFGQPQDPAYTRNQDQAFGRPQASAFDTPQAPGYNRLQSPEYERPQASAYNRVQAPDYGQPQAAAYGGSQPQYYNYAQLQRDQLQRAQIQRAQIQRAQLQRVQLQRAQLQRAQLQRAYYNQPAQPKAAPKPVPAPTPAPTLPPTKPPAPTPRTSCPGNCPKWCVPRCNIECCDPKPPPMPEYLKRQQLTAKACEGHKLKIMCPNRSDKIIMYSTFYGREKNDTSTCHHDILPSKGTCNDQEHHVNEKVFNLCGHERRCIVAVNNKFLAKDNTTICPGVYKYLKVIYKCNQHPKIFPICPLPCKNPKNCFPSCKRDCCSPQPPKPAPPPSPPPVTTCPAPCPSTCKPPCTPQCCYSSIQREELKPYFGIKPKPKPKPQPAMPNMYASQASRGGPIRPQPSYYTNPYSSYQTPQNPLANYQRYDMQSSCPAACKMTCATFCPQQCCSLTSGRQNPGQVVNYYG